MFHLSSYFPYNLRKAQRTAGTLTSAGVLLRGITEVRGALPPPTCTVQRTVHRDYLIFLLLLHICFLSLLLFLTWEICWLALEKKTDLGVGSHSFLLIPEWRVTVLARIWKSSIECDIRKQAEES